jgi:hypothetical protein
VTSTVTAHSVFPTDTVFAVAVIDAQFAGVRELT